MSFKDELSRLKNTKSEIEKRIVNLEQEIERFSTFDSNQMGNFIADLINTPYMSEEKFTYMSGYIMEDDIQLKDFKFVNYGKFKVYVNFLISNSLLNRAQKLYLDETTKELDRKKLNMYADMGDILIFNCSNEPHIIKFYKYYKRKESLIDKRNFGEFEFAYDFIDYVISYKYESGIDNISIGELSMLKDIYLSKNSSKIAALEYTNQK